MAEEHLAIVSEETLRGMTPAEVSEFKMACFIHGVKVSLSGHVPKGEVFFTNQVDAGDEEGADYLGLRLRNSVDVPHGPAFAPWERPRFLYNSPVIRNVFS